MSRGGLTVEDLEDYLEGLEDLRGLVLSSGFIDGSYDYSGRLSSSVVVLAACGVKVVDGRYSGVYGSTARDPVVYASRYPVFEETSPLIMQAFELATANRMLSDGDVDLLFLDGALYASLGYTLMTKHHSSILDRVRGHRGLEEASVKMRLGDYAEALRLSEEAVEEVVEGGVELLGLGEAYPVAYHVVWDQLRLGELERLLGDAERRGVGVFWLSKECSLSLLSRRMGYKWLSDPALLAHVMPHAKPSYLVAHRLIDSWPPQGAPWGLVYVKLGPATPFMCLTYPLASEGLLECALGTLYTLSTSMGYPEPMAIVHSRSTVSRGLARLIADRLYEASGDVRLAKTVREAVGLG